MLRIGAAFALVSSIGCWVARPEQNENLKRLDQLEAEIRQLRTRVESQGPSIVMLDKQVGDVKRSVSDLASKLATVGRNSEEVERFLLMERAKEQERNWLRWHPVEPDWKDEMRVAVQAHKAVVGMTMNQLYASWGRPVDTKKAITEKGESIVCTFKPNDWWAASPPNGSWVVELEGRTLDGGKKDFLVVSIRNE